MDWLADVAAVAGSAASGGVLGVVGGLFGSVAKFVQERQRQQWEQAKWNHELKLHELQMQQAHQQHVQELEVVRQQGSWQGLEASMQSFQLTSEHVAPWVNNVRSLFRPALTVALWIMSLGIIAALFQGVEYLTQAEANELIAYGFRSIVFSASTATAWWFADRALQPPEQKKR